MTQEKEKDEELEQKQQYIRVIAVIWMVVALLTTILGFFNLFIMSIMSTGGDPYREGAEVAAFSGFFWIFFGVGAVLVGFGLLKLNFYAWIVFEIQTGLATLIFLYNSFSGGLFGFEFIQMEFVYFVASLGCLVLLALTYTLRDQFRTKT
ncbi:MAG: hypothetical protein ACXADY_10955 [Candidatus Hodarchaeales archaeon]